MPYPTTEIELDFEFILYNHLKVLSDNLAQGKADLESMILVYEQYSMSQLTWKEREVLRKFKIGISEMKEKVYDFYSAKLRRETDFAKKAEIINEREDTLDEIERIELKFLLRWLVACTRKRFKAAKHDPYSKREFFTDLLIEIRNASLSEFCSKIFEEGVNDNVELRGAEE